MKVPPEDGGVMDAVRDIEDALGVTDSEEKDDEVDCVASRKLANGKKCTCVCMFVCLCVFFFLCLGVTNSDDIDD